VQLHSPQKQTLHTKRVMPSKVETDKGSEGPHIVSDNVSESNLGVNPALQTDPDTFTYNCNICGFAASLLLSVLYPLQIATGNNSLQVFTGLLYIPYCAPDFPTFGKDGPKWFDIFNDFLVVATIGKGMVDVLGGIEQEKLKSWNDDVSPILDCIANITWEIPTIGALVDSHTPKDGVNFLGNTLFNMGGWFAPFKFAYKPLVVGLCTAGYGTCMFSQNYMT